MGTRTFVAESGRAARGVDQPLLLALIGLLVFGLAMMFSASWDFSLSMDKPATYMFSRQLLWLALGLIGMTALSHFDYHLLRKWIVPAMVGTISLLIVVLLVKEIRFGAMRSILNGSVQPSELAKLVSVIYLSVWLYSKRKDLHHVGFGVIPLSVILGIIGGLILAQPDLSAAGTIILMGGLLFFLAGGDLKQIIIILAVAILVALIVVKFSVTGQERLTSFLVGLMDPKQASYHVLRSFEAIVQGGLFGLGLGNSQSKMTGLPVPPTDSIFAVIVEEMGVVGAIFLMGLYAMLIWRGMIIARRAPDMLGTLLASGLVAWLGLEALINMSVMVGLMPFAGNALPFISAGGSSLTVSLAAVGILMNISRQRGEMTEQEDEWRSFGAIIDLRRRNGRRRLSRARRA
jgi:cell division protein FtsW